MILRGTWRRWKCSECRRWFIRQLTSNEPAYCSYSCGAKAQPEHTKRVLHSGVDGRSTA